MAINTLPAQQIDNWVQLGTSTPTSGTVVSFTSIPSDYRKLWVLTNSSLGSSSAILRITLNSITAASSYKWWGPTSQTSAGMRYGQDTGITNYPVSANSQQYSVVMTNKTSSMPFSTFQGYGGAGGNASSYEFGWVNSLTSAITRVDITTDTSFTGNTGTITLYGTY
jgi:hypothetical protein